MNDIKLCSIAGRSYYAEMIVYDSANLLKAIAQGKKSRDLENLAKKEGIYGGQGDIFSYHLYGKYYYIEHHYVDAP